MSETIILDVLPIGAPFALSANADNQLKKRGIRPVRGGYLSLPLAFGVNRDRIFLFVAAASPDKKIKVGSTVDLEDKTTLTAWARIDYPDLSSAARSELENAIDKIVSESDALFTDFFNRASPITTRLHSLELIPGIGKKHMWEVIESRRKPFANMDEIKQRLPSIPDPRKGIRARILKELQEDEKYCLFSLPKRR
jgi:predicted nucleic acid-binding OB-fold protein